jgi:hypothetical protein
LPLILKNLDGSGAGAAEVAVTGTALKIFVYGSEYAKGTTDANRISVDSIFHSILKLSYYYPDKYQLMVLTWLRSVGLK